MPHEKLHRHASELHDHDGPAPGSTSPGKVSLTQRMMRPIVLRVADRGGEAAAGAEGAIDRAAGSSGHALPEALRARFESSLGSDLSGVRLHTGGESAEAADAVGARAYAIGDDVHFAAGAYDPSSEAGQLLIAHEVAHTVQQRGGAPERRYKLEVTGPGDAVEAEADRAASAMISGAPYALSAAGPQLARTTSIGGKAGLNLQTKGVQLAGELGPKFSTPLGKFGKLELGLVFAGEGNLQWWQTGTAMSGGAAGSANTKPEGGVEAPIKFESKVYEDLLAKQQYEESKKATLDGYAVASYKVLGEAKAKFSGDPTASSGPKDAHSAMAGVQIDFVNGQSVKLMAGAQVSPGRGGASGWGLSVTWDIPIRKEKVKIGEFCGQDVTFDGKGGVKVTGEVSPDLDAVAAEAATQVAKGGAKSAATGGGAATGVALSAEAMLAAMGGALIIGTMGFAFAANANDLAEADACVAGANRARRSWADGYCNGLGVARVGEEMAPYREGIAAGQAKLAEIVAQVRGQVDATVTDAEIKLALAEAGESKAGEIVAAARRSCDRPIALRYIEAFYAARKATFLGGMGLMQTMRNVAGRLGVPDWKPAADDAPAPIPAPESGMPRAPSTPDAPGDCDPDTASCEDVGPRAD